MTGTTGVPRLRCFVSNVYRLDYPSAGSDGRSHSSSESQKLEADRTFNPHPVVPLSMVRETLTLALSRARYAAMGAAIGAGLGGLFGRRAASTGGALGALIGAFVGESRITTKNRIEEWRSRGKERV